MDWSSATRYTKREANAVGGAIESRSWASWVPFLLLVMSTARLMCDIDMEEELELRRLEGRSVPVLARLPMRTRMEEEGSARAELVAEQVGTVPVAAASMPAATGQRVGPVPVVPCLVASAMPIEEWQDGMPLGLVTGRVNDSLQSEQRRGRARANARHKPPDVDKQPGVRAAHPHVGCKGRVAAQRPFFHPTHNATKHKYIQIPAAGGGRFGLCSWLARRQEEEGGVLPGWVAIEMRRR